MSISGIGATDGAKAYSGRITDEGEAGANINEVEAINMIIALHSFLRLTEDNMCMWSVTSSRPVRPSHGGEAATPYLQNAPGWPG